MIASVAPMKAPSTTRAQRPPTCPPAQYFLETRTGPASTIRETATASHAPLDLDNTSAAATSPTLIAPRSAPMERRAVTVHQTIAGRPIAATCATKLRLPKVPPGARLALKYSVSTP